jgi:two-component system sensor histidine kinase MprB
MMTHSVASMLNHQQYQPIAPPSPHNDEFTQLATVLSRLITTLENRSRRDRMMLAEAAHQLRTPLEVIRGNLDILTNWESIEPETEADSLEALRRAAEGMTTLVENLLTLEHARNSANELSPIALHDLVEEVGEDAKAIATQHTVAYHVPANDPATVTGNVIASRRALWALVENALKYAEQDTPIQLTLAQRAEGWVIAVTNYGDPIAEDDIPHLFERFYRASSTHHIAGHGLGLAIAKALMESQNGTISVESQHQETTFSLFWPREPKGPHRAR